MWLSDDQVRADCVFVLPGHTNIMLTTFDNQASAATVNAATVNPYWMNPTYQRPAPTPASDLGYSTMTPHGGDDTSEQAAHFSSTITEFWLNFFASACPVDGTRGIVFLTFPYVCASMLACVCASGWSCVLAWARAFPTTCHQLLVCHFSVTILQNYRSLYHLKKWTPYEIEVICCTVQTTVGKAIVLFVAKFKSYSNKRMILPKNVTNLMKLVVDL